MIARPNAASARTSVIRTVSVATLTKVSMWCRHNRAETAPAPDLSTEGEDRSNWLLERQIAACILGLDRGHRLYFLEHVIDARPPLPNSHEIGWNDNLIVEAAHLNWTLRRLIEGQLLQSLAYRSCFDLTGFGDSECAHMRGVVHADADGVHERIRPVLGPVTLEKGLVVGMAD